MPETQATERVGSPAGSRPGSRTAACAAGSPVGLFAPNRTEWIVAALAMLDARAVVVSMDAQSRGDDLAHFRRDSGTRRIFTVRDHAPHLAALGLERAGRERGSRAVNE